MNRDRCDVLDELLVLRCREGDTRALELLAARWHPRVLRRAARLTGDPDAARDVAQEAWIAIARGLGRLRDPACFRSWAYSIVGHKSRDWIRRERAGRRALRRAAQHERTVGRENDPSEGRPEEMARIRRALAELPAEQRSIISWFYLKEMSVREISQALAIPPGTVKSRLYHARNALRECVEEES